MVNTSTNGAISLSQAVALHTLYPTSSSVRQLEPAQKEALRRKRDEYREAPELLVKDATNQQLFLAIYVRPRAHSPRVARDQLCPSSSR